LSVQTEFQYGYVLHPKGEVEAMPEPKGADGGFSLEQLQDKVGGLIEPIVPNPHLLGHADFAIKGRIFLIKGDRVTEGDLNTITWDSLMGCYTMSWQGMLLGIETDGHIHS
jgi:hypothetical protein